MRLILQYNFGFLFSLHNSSYTVPDLIRDKSKTFNCYLIFFKSYFVQCLPIIHRSMQLVVHIMQRTRIHKYTSICAYCSFVRKSVLDQTHKKMKESSCKLFITLSLCFSLDLYLFVIMNFKF